MAKVKVPQTKVVPTSIDDIEKNVQEIMNQIMRRLTQPTYYINYPDLDSWKGGFKQEQVDMNGFANVWTRMQQARLTSVQAEMAVAVINERFRLPMEMQTYLNLLLNELNKFKMIIQDQKVQELNKLLRNRLYRKEVDAEYELEDDGVPT